MVNPITYILRKWAFVRMGVYEFQYKSEFKISDGYNMFTYIIVDTVSLSVSDAGH